MGILQDYNINIKGIKMSKQVTEEELFDAFFTIIRGFAQNNNTLEGLELSMFVPSKGKRVIFKLDDNSIME